MSAHDLTGTTTAAAEHTTDAHMSMTVTAALLAAGRVAALVAHLAALLAGLALLLAAPAALARLACAAVLVLWPCAAWLALRVEFDARLFAALDPDAATLAGFDAALVRLGLRAAAPPRDVATRCAGALALWRRLLGCVALQLALLGVALALLL
ncbi:hypothetical protein EV699_10798 [Plasticicumulans lactativorans]|uniref:Uncharacterized protein n=1 Tax=Plasticicumulans lactativorans TaxID=1133106 RepID=A0A4R2LBM6_9GAMM|nr:hypothetical protein [Plasticicumulans lactativorans]TCO81705.1 hypothetical protein EV699_10798 [Plasticicumulans lactativorans]